MSPDPKDTCLAHVRLFGPWAARLSTGSFGWAVGTDPTAHLNAAFLLLSLLPLARAVPVPSTLGQGCVKNLRAEQSSRAMELTEVTEGDDGIHGDL